VGLLCGPPQPLALWYYDVTLEHVFIARSRVRNRFASCSQLFRETDRRTSYVATNEIELEDVFLDGGQVEESSQGNLEEKKMK
jgi:hypothetical protein